jgi:flagellar basal-body rod protein FlgB
MADVLFDPTMRGLTTALTLHSRRHEVLASNLANVETPGFRARDLDFEAAMQAAFSEPPAEAAQVPGDPEARVIEDKTAPTRADGNSVDLDLQMVQLSANGSRFVTIARMLAKRLATLRTAIEGSR